MSGAVTKPKPAVATPSTVRGLSVTPARQRLDALRKIQRPVRRQKRRSLNHGRRTHILCDVRIYSHQITRKAHAPRIPLCPSSVLVMAYANRPEKAPASEIMLKKAATRTWKCLRRTNRASVATDAGVRPPSRRPRKKRQA